MKLNKMTVGKKYGKALYELAAEKNLGEDIFEELQKVRLIFQDNPKLAYLLGSDALSSENKKSLLATLTKETSPLVTNFLNLLFAAKRLTEIGLIIDNFAQSFWEGKKIAHGTVTTAVAISSEQREKMERRLENKLAFKHVELTNLVDKEIIGGVIVNIDRKIIDGSLRKKMINVQKLLQIN